MMNTTADQTTLSVLYSQPISGLQIRDVDEKWRWVKHLDNALVRPKARGVANVLKLSHDMTGRHP